MEQLINAATPYNYAMLAFLFFGVGSICFGIIIFIVSAMAAGKELLIMLNHFHIGNKNVRYILTAISVGITVFALVQLSTDIGTALFGVEGVNARMPKPNP